MASGPVYFRLPNTREHGPMDFRMVTDRRLMLTAELIKANGSGE